MFTFALLLAFASAGPAHANCGKKYRIKHGDAECLTAKWDNSKDWLSRSEYEIKNKCSSLGTVVAKIDIKNLWDRTVYLSDDEWEESSLGFADIRHIYCCTDLSDLCNRSDIEDDN